MLAACCYFLGASSLVSSADPGVRGDDGNALWMRNSNQRGAQSFVEVLLLTSYWMLKNSPSNFDGPRTTTGTLYIVLA